LQEADGAWPDEVLKAAGKVGANVLLPVSELGFRQLAIHQAALVGKLDFVKVPEVRTLDRLNDKAALAEFAAQAVRYWFGSSVFGTGSAVGKHPIKPGHVPGL
jgi:hypothetical protein